jgi:hypothetical protein
MPLMKVMAKKAGTHEKHDCPLKPTECPLGCGDLMNARDIPYVRYNLFDLITY